MNAARVGLDELGSDRETLGDGNGNDGDHGDSKSTFHGRSFER